MMSRSKFFSLLLIIAALDFNQVYARGGGGSSAVNGEHGIIFTVIAFLLLPFFILYSIVATVLIARKQKRIIKITRELAKEDELWNLRKMLARVQEIFFAVQNGWSLNDVEITRSMITSKIYEQHKFQIDEMKRQGTRNVLENIKLLQATVISVHDFKNNSLDRFSVKIKASMHDYFIDELTGKIIAGENKPAKFTELWPQSVHRV